MKAAASCALLLAAAAAATPAEFDKHWNDGKAELDGYRLVQPRYGQARDGWAAMVWVTEPFRADKQVKADPPYEKKSAVQVLKLNLFRRFKTGLYDYSLMLSVFSPLKFDEKAPLAAHRALKVSFSAQDWCGQVFHQLNVRGGFADSEWRSYFESEGDGKERLTLGEDTVLEDELWFRLRGVTRPLAPGRYRFIPSLATARLAHTSLAAGTMEVKRAAESEQVKVPAGSFETVRYLLVLMPGDGRPRLGRTVWVEKAYPHRVIAWEGDVPGLSGNEPASERGELTGSMRDTYWQHNRLEDVALRRALELPE